MIRLREDENETFCARSFLLGALFWNSKRVSKMKDKLDDEIKLAGLESLVPEELEKSDPQFESLANFRGCAPGSRDVCGGELRFKNQ